VLSGEFVIVNKHLLKDLIEQGYWNEEVKELLIAANGSVQNIEGLPEDLKELYKTAYEIKQRTIIDMSADRGAFIDQSQSLNVHMEDTNFGKLSSLHFTAWKLGLKTGMYYLRTRPAVDAIKFTIKESNTTVAATPAMTIPQVTNEEAMMCSLDNPEDCVSCGS
jgi:ribonucleoside-diphosphate reductase alpha chain